MTWQDIKKIVEIADEFVQLAKDQQWSEKEYYKFILNQYENPNS